MMVTKSFSEIFIINLKILKQGLLDFYWRLWFQECIDKLPLCRKSLCRIFNELCPLTCGTCETIQEQVRVLKLLIKKFILLCRFLNNFYHIRNRNIKYELTYKNQLPGSIAFSGVSKIRSLLVATRPLTVFSVPSGVHHQILVTWGSLSNLPPAHNERPD